MKEELTSLGTETGKLYREAPDPKTGAPRYTQEIATGPIHYKKTYADGEPWEDIDGSYAEASEIKGIGKVLVYPQLPNIVTVFQDMCGYQIQSRSNPDHIARVELVSIDGLPVTTWLDTAALKTSVRVHPYRVGIWKDFSKALSAKATTMRWKVTELGDSSKDTHPFVFRDAPEAYSVADLTSVDPAALEQAKVAIETQRTRIDDTSWHWDEIIPAEAKLVDTDYQVGAAGGDGYWNDGVDFHNDSTWGLVFGGYTDASQYNCFALLSDIAIPRGSTINSAVLYMYCANGYARSEAVTSVVYCNDADSASAPTGYADANSKDLTTASYSWVHEAWGNDTWHNTGSMVTVVQEVTDRAGWATGNDLLILNKVSGQAQNHFRWACSYGQNASLSPFLRTTWTEPVLPIPQYYYNHMRA